MISRLVDHNLEKNKKKQSYAFACETQKPQLALSSATSLMWLEKALGNERPLRRHDGVF